MSEPRTRRPRPTRQSPAASGGGRWRRWAARVGLLGVACALLGVLGLGGLYWWVIVREPAPHMERESILRVISAESPVYYRDGKTKIGVFFSEEHRQYVPAGKLPKDFVHALVSAEDRTFFSHVGFSPKGISRAMFQNLTAGRTVAGGSTLTQQTAKNLFKRRGRTYKEKLRELANALRLERRYTKLEILEFYSNQFYVNGNGRGLGIAGRFFFDKAVDELDLLECAFLAGIVKSPNRYNPFVPDPARRDRAIAAGRERADYVLRRMHEDGRIDQAAFDRETARPIPYQRGRFRFERSVVLDAVEQELDSAEFRRTLAAHGIADPGSAGLRIVTTLDPEMQRGAVHALRHHLSDVGLWLEDPGAAGLVTTAPTLHPIEASRLVPRSFHLGVLTGVDVDAATATVDLGDVEGVIGPAAWSRVATALLRGEKKNTWVTAGRAQRASLLETLAGHVGQGVSVSVIRRTANGTVELDLEPPVELEGGVLVLEEGSIRAMVGGWANVDFNRATSARRQLGSTWKPLLFEAALQLGWQATDPLDNRRAVFPYQSTFYYPRPDHRGAPPQVSMGWAAVKSENLASVWLLEHLSDRLTEPQFGALAAHVGLRQADGESRKAFVGRIQAAGVLPTDAKLTEGLFHAVWRDVITPDLLFEGREDDIAIGTNLQYGLGFDEERAQVKGGAYDVTADERAIRLATLDRSFRRQEALAERAARSRAAILERVGAGEPVRDQDLAGFAVRRPGDGGAAEVAYGDRHDDGWEPLTADALATLGVTREQDEADPESDPEPRSTGRYAPEVPIPGGPSPPDDTDAEPLRIRSGGRYSPGQTRGQLGTPSVRAFAITDLLDPATVRLEGLLTVELVQRTRAALDDARQRLGDVDLYSLDGLSLIRDYRRLVHLRYLVGLARRSGVRSEIVPVMSLPLGSSDVTLLEAALMYQGMLTGQTFRFYPDVLSVAPGTTIDEPVGDLTPQTEHRDDVSLIAEVLLSDGRLIYRTERHASPLQSAGITAELGGMLRAVVTDGTGRRARAGVRPGARTPERLADLESRGAVLPLFGKTGTTNSYKNSAFVGFIPGLPERSDAAPGTEPLLWGRGLVVAVYVGYDDNRPMRNGAVRLAGASGSLPAWLGTVEAVARASDIGDRVDLVELDFAPGGVLPLTWPPGTEAVAVDPATGLPIAPGTGSGVAWLRRRTTGPAFAPVDLKGAP